MILKLEIVIMGKNRRYLEQWVQITVARGDITASTRQADSTIKKQWSLNEMTNTHTHTPPYKHLSGLLLHIENNLQVDKYQATSTAIRP